MGSVAIDNKISAKVKIILVVWECFIFLLPNKAMAEQKNQQLSINKSYAPKVGSFLLCRCEPRLEGHLVL